MNIFTLWENELYTIGTPKNPHMTYVEGLHIIISPKKSLSNAWEEIDVSTETFRLAAEACKIMEQLKLAPWFNIQANGNWGLLPGAKPFFHIHVYGRNKTKLWGKPLPLPVAPNTYQNDPMPENDREALSKAFSSSLINF